MNLEILPLGLNHYTWNTLLVWNSIENSAALCEPWRSWSSRLAASTFLSWWSNTLLNSETKSWKVREVTVWWALKASAQAKALPWRSPIMYRIRAWSVAKVVGFCCKTKHCSRKPLQLFNSPANGSWIQLNSVQFYLYSAKLQQLSSQGT